MSRKTGPPPPPGWLSTRPPRRGVPAAELSADLSADLPLSRPRTGEWLDVDGTIGDDGYIQPATTGG